MDTGRKIGEARKLSRPVPALTGNNLIVPVLLEHDKRLEYAMLFDRRGEFLEGFLLEGTPRLLRVGLELFDGDEDGLVIPGFALRQGVKFRSNTLLCLWHPLKPYFTPGHD
jgi:hypothetical protein